MNRVNQFKISFQTHPFWGNSFMQRQQHGRQGGRSLQWYARSNPKEEVPTDEEDHCGPGLRPKQGGSTWPKDGFTHCGTRLKWFLQQIRRYCNQQEVKQVFSLNTNLELLAKFWRKICSKQHLPWKDTKIAVTTGIKRWCICNQTSSKMRKLKSWPQTRSWGPRGP